MTDKGNKLPLQINRASRYVQPQSGESLGFLRPIKDQIERLNKEIEGLSLRLSRGAPNDAEPAAVVGKKIFSPEAHTFSFDYLQDGVSSVKSQYVLRDAVTYEIPVVFPPPGVFVARAMTVKLTQRVFHPDVGVMQIPMSPNFFTGQEKYFAINPTPEGQTKKYQWPSGNYQTGKHLSFFWNLIDTKSGARFSDELMPDMLLLPQLEGDPAASLQSGLPFAASQGFLQFPVPWLFERDAQLTFQFRPITPVLQPTADSGFSPYSFDDLEQNGQVRDSSVTVSLEIHGTRYLSLQDATRQGALV